MALHPGFPVVEGLVPLTADWSFFLAEAFSRRLEDGSLVLWRPGLTFWISVSGNDTGTSPEVRLEKFRRGADASRRNERVTSTDAISRFSYELLEHDLARTPSTYTALYSFSVASVGHVLLAAYCDASSDLAAAYDVVASVSLTAPLVPPLVQ